MNPGRNTRVFDVRSTSSNSGSFPYSVICVPSSSIPSVLLYSTSLHPSSFASSIIHHHSPFFTIHHPSPSTIPHHPPSLTIHPLLSISLHLIIHLLTLPFTHSLPYLTTHLSTITSLSTHTNTTNHPSIRYTIQTFLTQTIQYNTA